jgi:hypothetical protein
MVARSRAPASLPTRAGATHEHLASVTGNLPESPFFLAESAHLQEESEYRYRDSNPGFRRERAAS